MNHKKILIWLFLIILPLGCDKRSERLSFLTGDPSLDGFVSLERDSVTMYASPEDKKAGRIECRIYEDEYPVFISMLRTLDNDRIKEAYRSKGQSRFAPAFIDEIKSMAEANEPSSGNSDLPLAGVRVAIDPGHSAGSFDEAVRENKYMWLFSRDGGRIKFYEAQLNLETAFILKGMLEKTGATVMLTRDSGKQAYPVPFNAWLARHFTQAVYDKMRDKLISPEAARLLLTRADYEFKLKFFNSEFEMPYRAKLINNFHPHVTVLVHYDSREDETAYIGKYLRIRNILENPYVQSSRKLAGIREVVKSIPETKRNYCTAFVPGCFLRHELNSLESRIEFLRLIISPDLDNSVIFFKIRYRELQELPERASRRRVFSRGHLHQPSLAGPVCAELQDDAPCPGRPLPGRTAPAEQYRGGGRSFGNRHRQNAGTGKAGCAVILRRHNQIRGIEYSKE